MKPAGEKIQKILAACGAGSRRAVEEMIAQGRVTVNRRPAHIGARAGRNDVLAVDGRPVRRRSAPARLIFYNKPLGKIVERGAANSVFADLPPPGTGRWINVGRLDVNSEGLLLFSTDGEEVERMAHPRNAVEREYLARVDGELTAAQVEEIRDGAVVDGKPLRPAYFGEHKKGEGRNCWYRVVLLEGRNRAVRRLFAHFGLQTARLIRIRMGDHELPRDLPPGGWREASQ